MWEIHVSKLYWNPLWSKRWITTRKFFKTRRSSEENFLENFQEFFKLSDFRSWGCSRVGLSRNSSDSCWEHWIKFILDWVWVKSLNGGMSNASRFMTQHVFKDPNPILNQGDWSGRGQAIVVKFDHKLFEALCDHHKSSCLILPIISTSHIGLPAHVGTIVKDYWNLWSPDEVPGPGPICVRLRESFNWTSVQTTKMLPQSDPVRFSKWLQLSSFWV